MLAEHSAISGGSNKNSFRLLTTFFGRKDSIDLPILSSELSQIERIDSHLIDVRSKLCL